MSYKIDGQKIILTRGDTFRAKIQMNVLDEQGNPTGEIYTPTAGDRIRFALKHNVYKEDTYDYPNEYTQYNDDDPLVVREIPTDTMILEIEPNDTKGLGFGNYVYDVEITYEDGTVYTFITKAPFKLTEEVE